MTCFKTIIIRKYYYSLRSFINHKLRLLTHIILNKIARRKNPIVYCIGDSHNRVFDYIKAHKLLPNIDMRCATVVGATVYGLANPNSKTNALPIFLSEIKHAPPDSIIFITLGEIDCGFLIWYRSEKNGSTIKDEKNESLMRYMSFLNQIKNIGIYKIVLVSVPPQTIDQFTKGDIANARKSVKANINERQHLTNEYNKSLSMLCTQNGYLFMDMDKFLIDKYTGLIKRGYISKQINDHHLDMEAVSHVYAQNLESMVTSYCQQN